MFVVVILTAIALLSAQDRLRLPPQAEVAVASKELARLQLLSFATEREYCGYYGQGSDEAVVFTPMIRGGHDGCTPMRVNAVLRPIASLRTHGTHDPWVPAEYPTSVHIQSDAAEGINGYVPTSGGRLWYIDSSVGLAVQICGPGCLPHNPAFRVGDDGPILEIYSNDQLLRLEGQD
jgi:hypothetical protein